MRAALAQATGAVQSARDMAIAYGQVATGRTFGVEVEIEKAARRRPAEVQRRREAEALAVRTMEQAAIAADLLRADPGRGGLPISDLLRLAETERRLNMTAQEAREGIEVVSSGPRPY